MLLALDVGNSEVTAGLFRGDDLAARWRLTTHPDRTPDEWSMALEAFIVRSGHAAAEVSSACIGSVVPNVTPRLLDAVRDGITAWVSLVEPGAALPITLDVDEPLAVGADRIACALGALAHYPGDSIVIGFGTATTFNCVTGDRRFVGGAIMPGLRTSAEQLVQKAARLMATELRPPSRAIGRTTDDNIRSGVMLGAADAADGMIRRIRAEWPGGATPRVIATGGLAAAVAPLCSGVEMIDIDLTLRGLRVAATALDLPT
ncbi:MAG: type III pantothenate kinase [Gemmatimonadales bacterium]